MNDGDPDVDGEAEMTGELGTEQTDGPPSLKPSRTQLLWLQRGLDQAGGKLPLFDRIGQKVSEKTVRSSIKNGWAEPWFNNPIKPDWLVCRLTETGRELAESAPRITEDDL